MEKMITPVFAGVFSVIRARPDLRMWLPYRNDISEDGFTQTCMPGSRRLSVKHTCAYHAASNSVASTVRLSGSSQNMRR